MKNTSSTVFPILRCISSDGADLVIPACDGSETLADASDVFKSGIDRNFKKWGLSKSSKSTQSTTVNVYDLVKNANFKAMFTYLTADWEELCLTEHQIKVFCKKFSNWLSMSGYGTFFLTKKDWKKSATIGNLFIVGVDVYYTGLNVRALRFGHGHKLYSIIQLRLVFPQTGL